MREEIFEIEVLNWEKFQHKNGTKTYDWFKLSSKILHDVEMDSLSDLEFRVWIKLLSLCALYRQSTVKVTLIKLRSSRYHTRIDLQSCLHRFEQYQWVTIKSGTLEENRREENRNTPTPLNKIEPVKKKPRDLKVAECSFPFEEIYEAYPRKRGKQKGMAQLVKITNSKEQFDLIKRSVSNFAKAMAKEDRPIDKIPYFSTFISSQWKDYVEQEPLSAISFDFGERANLDV